jgi:hypothetical protein
MKRNQYVGLGLLALAGTLGVGSFLLQKHSVVEAAAVTAPRFEVDPLWPKPLPNHWIMDRISSRLGGRAGSRRIIHRGGSLEAGETHATTNPPIAQCCAPAPPVLEFDQAGNLIGHWGGPGAGYNWPDSNHGITVDYKGNVWIGGNGRGPQSARGAINGSDEEPAAGKAKGKAAPAFQSFSDNMVLQQDATANVWGWAEKGEKVVVKLGETTVEATANDDGRWAAKLKALLATVDETTVPA